MSRPLRPENEVAARSDTMSHERSLAQFGADFAAVARRAAHRGAPVGSLTVLLHIGEEEITLLSGQGDQPVQPQQLDLGTALIARDYFRHDPPTAREIALAIDFVEDEIMRLGKPPEPGSTLWSTSPALRPWADAAGPTMPIETVEQRFQRLASTSLGQPGAIQGLPSGREAAATLLVLREFMHHRGHASIVSLEPPDAVAR